MDMGAFNLFMKLLEQESTLSQVQLHIIKNRLLADEELFMLAVRFLRGRVSGPEGDDQFKQVLDYLLST